MASALQKSEIHLEYLEMCKALRAAESAMSIATDFAREMSCMDMKMEKYNKLSYLHNSLQTSVIARITQKVEAMPSMSENECDTFIKTITASLGYVLRGNEYMSNRIKDCPCPRDKMCLYGIWFIKNKLAAIDNALMKLKEKPNVQ